MDGTLHVTNKNKKYVISKEMDSLPKKSCMLPLPPVVGEDERSIQKRCILEKERLV
jgi:hypothetical protein